MLFRSTLVAEAALMTVWFSRRMPRISPGQAGFLFEPPPAPRLLVVTEVLARNPLERPLREPTHVKIVISDLDYQGEDGAPISHLAQRPYRVTANQFVSVAKRIDERFDRDRVAKIAQPLGGRAPHRAVALFEHGQKR